MKPVQIAIAFNPKSGSFSQARLDKLRDAFAFAGWKAVFVDSYSSDFADIVSRSDHLCVVGGDGSIRDAVARIADMKAPPPLSVYPGGTINLVAREALYPTNIGKFVARVTSASKGRVHHHCVLNEEPMLVCASVGPDSEAVANLSEKLKARIGRFAYAAAFAKLLWRWPRNAIKVTADGEELTGEAAFVLKGCFFAGPWKISRQADLQKPEIRLVLLPTARRRDYVQLILSAAVHPIFASKNWHLRSATNVMIDGKAALSVQVDGDIAATLPVKINIAATPSKFA